MKIIKHKKKKIKTDISVDQPVMEDMPVDETVAETNAADSIEDFIELKRLQNRILGKLIDQISNSENSEK
jgi:hypothetical protein